MRDLREIELGDSVAKHSAARLVPKVVSGNKAEATEAAITLCKLSFPRRYPKHLNRSEIIERVREDLPKALHMRRIDFITHVDAKKVSPGKIKLIARLSNELTVDDQKTTLQTPDWITKADDFVVVVSGASVDSESVQQKRATLSKGDIGAYSIECAVDEGADHKLFVDFILDNQLLKRRSVSY